jgi:glucokinase
MSAPRGNVIGLDIGGTTIKAGMVTPGGEVIAQTVLPTLAGEGPGPVLAQAVKAVRAVIAGAGAGNGPAAGVGVGIPGIVSARDGLVRYPPNFTRWDHVDVSGSLRRETGLPVVTENDANCAALAEARFGAGSHHKDFIFVIWGTGVGGGIILDGKIYRGPDGGAGEIGHITIDRNGPECRCGNRGCIESYIGQRYLSDRARAVVEREVSEGRRSAILDLAGGDATKIEPELISRAAEAGDVVACAILGEAGAMLGTALSTVVNIMDITTAVIGGGISAAPDFVFDAAASEMRSRVLTPHRSSIVVKRAALGNQAGVIGAASLLLQ